MRLRWKACFVALCYSAIVLPDIFLFFRCDLVVELSLTCCCLGNLFYFFWMAVCYKILPSVSQNWRALRLTHTNGLKPNTPNRNICFCSISVFSQTTVQLTLLASIVLFNFLVLEESQQRNSLLHSHLQILPFKSLSLVKCFLKKSLLLIKAGFIEAKIQ